MDGDVRLTGHPSGTMGAVEICNDADWRPVCDDLWDTDDAIVVCRQLGLPTIGITIHTHDHLSYCNLLFVCA